MVTADEDQDRDVGIAEVEERHPERSHKRARVEDVLEEHAVIARTREVWE